MGVLKVKNWAKFQHYKHRRPPWIKLVTDTFQNYEFSCLQDASKLLAIGIWTLASRSKLGDGSVPEDFLWIKEQLLIGSDKEFAVTEENLQELINKGFIVRRSRKQDASTMLAPCKQKGVTETETETDRDLLRKSLVRDLQKRAFVTLWNAWPRHDKRQNTYQKFLQVSNGSVELVLARGLQQVKLWEIEKREKRFVPMLATWLHQKRFDTEPEEFAPVAARSSKPRDAEVGRWDGTFSKTSECYRCRRTFKLTEAVEEIFCSQQCADAQPGKQAS
jgi:hypothetical protein